MENNQTGEFYQILDIINTECDENEDEITIRQLKSSSIGDESCVELFQETKFSFGSTGSISSGLLQQFMTYDATDAFFCEEEESVEEPKLLICDTAADTIMKSSH